MQKLEDCCGCGAAPGQMHDECCDHARCPDCGEQLILCRAHDNRPAIWHGIDQHTEVAQKLGWWTTAVGFDHPVEDYTRVLFAAALHQIWWNRETQRYEITRIDEAELDAAMRRSGA